MFGWYIVAYLFLAGAGAGAFFAAACACVWDAVRRSDASSKRKQYKLLLNSDEEKYGGTGEKRPQVYKAQKQECDGRPYSFAYSLPPYGVAVFEF